METEFLDKLNSLKEYKFSNGAELYNYITENEEFRSLIRLLAKKFLEIEVFYCESCLMDAYIRLCKLDSEFAKKKVECQFRLKENALIYLNGKPITNYNLTNELAVEYLNENSKQWFEILPSNLEELLEDYRASLGKDKEVIKEEKKVAVIKEKQPLNKKKVGRPKKNLK